MYPMAENNKTMDRRTFVLRNFSFLVGSFLGLNRFSKAFAFGQHNKPLFQSFIALIIDDIGFSVYRARLFLKLGVPMTFAILPRLDNSLDLAIEICGEGHEIMLHQPMEPYASDIDPGPGALYVGDGTRRIIRTLEKNISSLPFVLGVNNHMGSKFTTRQKEMNEVLGVIKERNLFFVDSLTSGRSTGYKTAKSLHVATAVRNIFLDNLADELHILSQLHKLKKHALKYGCAIGIGHPFPETARAIGRFLKDLRSSDISLVPISKVLYT